MELLIKGQPAMSTIIVEWESGAVDVDVGDLGRLMDKYLFY